MTTATKPRRRKAKKPQNSTATPDPASDVSQETDHTNRFSVGQQIVMVDIDKLDRHPDNRIPSENSVMQIAESIQKVGQLEAILVRHASEVGEPERYQILGGETRWRACKELGKQQIACRILYDVDDTDALVVVAEANAAREDLNPIERANLARRLSDPVDQGGCGLSQEQVGKVLKLSRSAVSNCMRLLKLPAKIKKMVQSGLVPETFVRPLLVVFDSPAAKLVEASLIEVVGRSKDVDSVADDFDRTSFVNEVMFSVDEFSRSMKPAATRLRKDSWALKRTTGCYANCFFKPTEEQSEQLGIFYFEDEPRATNVELWEELNTAKATELLAKLKSKSGKANSGDDSSSNGSLTPEQQKAKEKTEDDRLQIKINSWRHNWLKWLIQREVNPMYPDRTGESDLVVDRLFGWIAGHVCTHNMSESRRFGFDEIDHPRNKGLSGADDWDFWGELDVTQMEDMRRECVWRMMVTEDPAGYTLIPTSILEDVATTLNIDIRKSWQSLDTHEGELFHEFVNLHNSRQVEKLARQLKVKLPDSLSTRRARIQHILENVKLIAVPGCIKPLPKKKAKRLKKRK